MTEVKLQELEQQQELEQHLEMEQEMDKLAAAEARMDDAEEVIKELYENGYHVAGLQEANKGAKKFWYGKFKSSAQPLTQELLDSIEDLEPELCAIVFEPEEKTTSPNLPKPLTTPVVPTSVKPEEKKSTKWW